MHEDLDLMELARKTARGKLAFQVHLAAYIAGSVFFFMLWYLASGYNISSFPWFLIPITGWGVGVVAHFIAAYRGGSRLQIIAEREYRRLKSKG